jgi:hypothetical protein
MAKKKGVWAQLADFAGYVFLFVVLSCGVTAIAIELANWNRAAKRGYIDGLCDYAVNADLMLNAEYEANYRRGVRKRQMAEYLKQEWERNPAGTQPPSFLRPAPPVE